MRATNVVTAAATANPRNVENLRAEAVIRAVLPNGKVSDGSQPPMTFDLSLSESAGSRSLDRLVRPLMSFGR
jgi:hypothetical protein